MTRSNALIADMTIYFNQGPEDFCDDPSAAPIPDWATCQQAAAALGWVEFGNPELGGGNISLDGAPRGCVIYMRSYHYLGVYWNSPSTSTPNPHLTLICQKAGPFVGLSRAPLFKTAFHPYLGTFCVSPSTQHYARARALSLAPSLPPSLSLSLSLSQIYSAHV